MGSRTVLAQLLSFVPQRTFRRCVERHRGNFNVRKFSCWDQFVCMLLAQLGRKESLREIQTCLRGMQGLLYRSGLRTTVARSTLAEANENRPSAIYADLCKNLIHRARALYQGELFIKDLRELVYILDSTTIDLSLTLCPWAYYGARPPAGLKVHTQLDLRGPIPSFVHISSLKMRDNFFLDSLLVEAGAFYVMDKAFFDLVRLYTIHTKRGYFITRPLRHVKFKKIKPISIPDGGNVLTDYLVHCRGIVGARNYPERLRLIRYIDPTRDKKLTFVTNNLDLPPQKIADLYKARWQIEIFFKWIKQNLHISAFLGRSRNAIETQIWIALVAYLLVAIAKKKLPISAPLTEIVNFLPSALFVEMPLLQAFSDFTHSEVSLDSSNQLKLL